MLERYTLPEMGQHFTDVAIWDACRDVELAAVRARVLLGLNSDEDVAAILQRTPVITPAVVDRIKERERTTDHDVAAFVDIMQEDIASPDSRWFHYGLTAADVTDTALGLRLTRASDLLIEVGEKLLATMCARAREFRYTPTAGQTHGQQAEIITFGVRLSNWAMMIERALSTLRLAREEIAVGTLSGPCGTYTNVDPEIEGAVCLALGLQPIMATQVIPRDLHANLTYACARLANSIAQFSFNTRIMATSQYGEVQEKTRPGQKGSTSMPHKRNPIKTEQFTGLAREFHGYLVTALQDVVLLFERDISHSAPERIFLADAMILAHYVTVKAEQVLADLIVKTDRMELNIEGGLELMYTQTVLNALMDGGMERDQAYRIIQMLSFKAIDENRPLRAILEEEQVGGLSPARLDDIFDQGQMLRYCDLIIDQLPR